MSSNLQRPMLSLSRCRGIFLLPQRTARLAQRPSSWWSPRRMPVPVRDLAVGRFLSSTTISETPTKLHQDTTTNESSNNNNDLEQAAALVEDLRRLQRMARHCPTSTQRLPPSPQQDLDEYRSIVDKFEDWLQQDSNDLHPAVSDLLLNVDTIVVALQVLIQCQYPVPELSSRVRRWERWMGDLHTIPMTDALSAQLLRVHGRAGNIGRALALLHLRAQFQFQPTHEEFAQALLSICSAGWHVRDQKRNIYSSDLEQPEIDNPTRWLDAILFQMSQRQFPLNDELVRLCLNAFSTTGMSGRATHFFYKVRSIQSNDDTQKRKVRVVMSDPPHWRKVPSSARNKTFIYRNKPDTPRLRLKRECDPGFSLHLAAAFSFCDSLQQGACGHPPFALKLQHYNLLLKACCNRGSLVRAMHLIDTVLPSMGLKPDIYSYSTLMHGLSHVADVVSMDEYYHKLLAQGITPNGSIVESWVVCLLNYGDVAWAVTIVQDMFNQFDVLPPDDLHLKILEMALARELVWEAKRYVHFLQQLWKWQPTKYHSKQFTAKMDSVKRNPSLSKPALKHLFEYFDQKLEDDDFF